MGYVIGWSDRASKALRNLDPPVARRILLAVGRLAEEPRPSASTVLVGGEGELRLRVGDWRVVYEVHDGELRVLVLNLGHRREVYRRR